MRFPGFIGSSYTLSSVNVDCQRCINLYPEINESGRGKEQEVASLISTPGLRLLVTLAGGVTRAIYTASNDRVFAVGGNKLYELDSDWTATELGTLNSETGPISMADNGIHLVIVDGADGHKFKFSDDSFAEITDDAFYGADQVAYLDGYFLFNKPDTDDFYYVDDVDLDFDALDVRASEGSPDPIVGILADHREVWVFNKKTTEVYYNAGDTEVFQRIEGAFIEHGCASAFSAAKMDNAVYWLGQDDKGAGIVYMARGYQPQRISTHAVEIAISQYTPSTARAYTYQENGHSFYVLNFDDADTTWVYDTTTGLWHERTYMNQGTQERHRANCHAYAFETHIVGDYENGKIYEMSSSVYTDNGDEIQRRRVAPHLSASGKRIFYNLFQLDIETGVGLDGTGQGTNPQVMMQFSDDHGHSWSNEKWASIGKIGSKKTQAKWHRLGSSRDRVFRITITDPVKVTVLGANLEFKVGAS